MTDDYVELTGDDLPYHLRLDAPPLAVCNRCGRKSWDMASVGTENRMTQPDGNPCGGRMIAPAEGANAPGPYDPARDGGPGAPAGGTER